VTGGRNIGAAQRRAFRVLGVAALSVLAVVLVAVKLTIQLAVGADWDTYSFVPNAAEWAGKGYGYTELFRPPLISLLASVPMRFGLEGPVVLQTLDAALSLLSLAAFYLLFRRRFGTALSAAGVLIVLASPPLWRWIGAGYTDLAAMGLCALSLLFVLKAADEDPRWYIAAFPTFLAAALMRHTSLLFGFALAVAVLLRARPFRHAKSIGLGLAATLATLLPFALYYQRTVGHALYPFVVSVATVQGMGSSGDAHMEIGSYVTGLPQLAAPAVLAPLTIGVLAFAALGLASSVIGSLRMRHVRARRTFAAVPVVAAAVVLARGAGLAGSAVITATATLVTWRLLASDAERVEGGVARTVRTRYALDAAMLVWLLCFFQFHEGWAQHFTRYYITMAPGVTYFVLLGAQGAVALLQAWARRESASNGVHLVSRIAVPALSVALAVSLALNLAATQTERSAVVAQAKDSAAWLASRPDIEHATIYSDVWPLTAYYLQRPVKAMPFFDSERAVQHELDVSGARYYVTLKGYRPRGWAVAHSDGGSELLAAKGSSTYADRLPRMLYLGAGWENYLEELADYEVDLVHREGEYNMEGSAYFDAYSAEQLARYDAVAAFGGLWHSRPGFEKTLEEYVRGGGTLVMDVSANMTRPHDLNRAALLGVVIDRKQVGRLGRIEISRGFSGRHPEIADVEASPWIAEDGSPWFGATYAPLPTTRGFRVLAALDGQTLVAEQSLGRGRILWVGSNLLWHAFTSGNPGEAKLVRAVLAEAVGSGRSPVASNALPAVSR